MSIETNAIQIFSPIGVACELRSTCRSYGANSEDASIFYKHIAPTGLKVVSLTPMGQCPPPLRSVLNYKLIGFSFRFQTGD